jgi:hypothetical protein
MPVTHINDSKHWRDRAAEMRVLSTTMHDVETITIMLRLADDYDILADRAEARAGYDTNAPSPRAHSRGFDIAHTGGRSLVWEKTTPTHCCRITAHGADVGDEAADPATVVFDVGLYNANGIWLTENDLTVRGAEAAADWCDKASERRPRRDLPNEGQDLTSDRSLRAMI